MRGIAGLAMVVALVTAVVASGAAQVATGQSTTGQSTTGQSTTGQVDAQRGAVQVTPGSAGTSQAPMQTAAADTRTEKQKALARQTERLFDMATELKAQVDKTSKNILSTKVVEKAQEIEVLAKGMKEQAKR